MRLIFLFFSAFLPCDKFVFYCLIRALIRTTTEYTCSTRFLKFLYVNEFWAENKYYCVIIPEDIYDK
jgi:hypothetical protein